jgi:hypothetical protein
MIWLRLGMQNYRSRETAFEREESIGVIKTEVWVIIESVCIACEQSELYTRASLSMRGMPSIRRRPH